LPGFARLRSSSFRKSGNIGGELAFQHEASSWVLVISTGGALGVEQLAPRTALWEISRVRFLVDEERGDEAAQAIAAFR
jgi:hypothetical protein